MPHERRRLSWYALWLICLCALLALGLLLLYAGALSHAPLPPLWAA